MKGFGSSQPRTFASRFVVALLSVVAASCDRGFVNPDAAGSPPSDAHADGATEDARRDRISDDEGSMNDGGLDVVSDDAIVSDAGVDAGSDASADAMAAPDPLHTSLATGRSHACSIESGRVFCWGGAGLASTRPGAVAGITQDVISVAAGSDGTTCALTKARTVTCWPGGQAPVQVAGLDDVSQVVVGDGFACALKGDGSVWCWGGNDVGQLGVGHTTPSVGAVPVVGLSTVVEIRAGAAHTCARTTAGGVWCWGANDAWQLGDGTTIARYAPVAVVAAPSGVVELALGPRHSCVRTSAGGVWCWGSNGAGEASSADSAFAEHPTQFEALGPSIRLWAGGYYVAGDYDTSATCSVKSDGGLWCSGRNAHGQLGSGSVGEDATDSPLRASAVSDLVELAIGGEHACDRGLDGRVRCWGYNFSGQLGRDNPFLISPERLENVGPFTEIAAGTYATFGRGASTYSAWGRNQSGELGVGDEAIAFAPATVTGLPTDVKQWGSGGLYTCWLRTGGQILCTGGQFGSVPVSVDGVGTDNVQLAIGRAEACARKMDGSIWCWGTGICGASVIEAAPALLVPGPTYTEVFTGDNATCTRRLDGSIWCCGDGWGNAGTQVPVGTDAVELAFGNRWCARKLDGTVLCGVGPNQVDPVAITDVVQLAVTDESSCARKVDGTVWCWGANNRGELGAGAGPNAMATPVQVDLTMPASAIAAGAEHVCALDAGGRISCWGDNYVGQAGDGTGGDRPRPALVTFP